MLREHCRLRIPGVVDDNRPSLGIVVGPVEAVGPHREAVLAVIIFAGRVGAARRGVGAEFIGETGEEARVRRVGALAVGDAIAFHSAADEVDDMEARFAGRLGEIDDAQEVPGAHLITMRIERGLGPLE